jgi:hypothetical protein
MRRKSPLGITPQCAIGLSPQTGFLAYAPGKRDRSSDIALLEELRSESLNPLSACQKLLLRLPRRLTQIKTHPPRSTMLADVRAGHGQKPREEGGRDHPLKLGPEFAPALFRSGTISMKLLASLTRERLGNGSPRSPRSADIPAANAIQICDRVARRVDHRNRSSKCRLFAHSRRPESVESRCGAVTLGRRCLFPPLSSGGALAA